MGKTSDFVSFGVDYIGVDGYGVLSDGTSDSISYINGTTGIKSGVAMSEDGTVMFTSNDGGVPGVYEHSLSIPFNVSSATYTSQSVSIGSAPYGIKVVNGGTTLYTVDDTDNTIYHWTMSVAWDLSTATSTSSFLYTGVTASARDMVIDPTGTKMILLSNNGVVGRYTLSTPWLISSSVWDSVVTDTNQSSSLVFALQSNVDGTKLYFYVAGTVNEIRQYSLPVPWEVDTVVDDSVILDTNVAFIPSMTS